MRLKHCKKGGNGYAPAELGKLGAIVGFTLELTHEFGVVLWKTNYPAEASRDIRTIWWRSRVAYGSVELCLRIGGY